MESTPSQATEKTTPGAPPVNGAEKPKRERRPRKPKTGEDGQPAPAKEDGAEPKPKRERPPKKDKDAAPKDDKKPNQDGLKKPKQEGEKKPKQEGEKKTNAPQYRKKGEKSSSPQPEKTPAGDDQPADKKKKRPQTSKNPEQKYRPKGSAPEGEEDGAKPAESEDPEKDPKEKKEKKEPPKNLVYKNPMEFTEKKKFKSKWEEYRHGDWRKGSGKTFVTLETVIPEQPKTLLKPPEEKTFHTKQQEIETKIKEINTGLDEKKTQFEEILGQKQAQMKAGDTGVVFSKELSQKFVTMGELKKKRQAIFNDMEKVEGDKGSLQEIKDSMRARIDKFYNTEELVPKGIKEATKTFQTASGNYKKEQEFLRRIEFLKASIPCIQKFKVADDKIKAMLAAKKKVSVDLPDIKKQMKQLQDEIDVLKKNQDVKTETKETFDKQLDGINERRKKMRDDRDKLFKSKEELQNTYYGALIDYSKQQYLLQDITWMNTMQENLRVRKAEKDKRDQEYKERKERIQKERDEKKQREEDRKQREIARKEKEIENKKMMEENLKSDEIEKLKRIEASITDSTLGSSPMFEQIEQCEHLKKFCLKQMKKDEPKTEEEKAEEKNEAQKNVKSDLEKALQKGSIQLAPSKEEKLAQMQSAIGSKGKGKKKNKGNAAVDNGTIDFVLIKKFNNLKINAPINDTDYEKTIKDLDELKEALIYWGKIIQRQNKIKFIRNARKISSIDEYVEQAVFEEKYIENEKSKFDGEDVADKTTLSLDKLKIAQVIDRENRTKRVWVDEEDEEEESDGEEQASDEEEARPVKKGQADLFGDDKPSKKKGGKRKMSDADEEETAPRQTQRPNAQKFKDIMKADDAFPTLENQFEDDDEDDLLDGETPAGEIGEEN